MLKKALLATCVWVVSFCGLLTLSSCYTSFNYNESKTRMDIAGYEITEMSPQMDNVAEFFVANLEFKEIVYVIKFTKDKHAKSYYEINKNSNDFPNIVVLGSTVYYGTEGAIAILVG